MSITIDTSTRAVNWETLLSSLGDVKKTDSVDGKQNFTITTNVDGKAQTVTVSVPDDLEIPETVDQSTLEGLVDKLKGMDVGLTDDQVAQMKDSIAKLYAEASAASSKVASKSTGKVLFDIYALLTLMIEVAQSQRDAAREMRTAENLAIQKAIQNQADDQRSAANIGLIVGVTCGAISAVASIGLMIGQGVSAHTQNKIMAQSGADAAKMHSQALQNTDSPANANAKLTTLQQKPGGEDIGNRVNAEFTQQLEGGAAGNLTKNLDDAIGANNAAKKEVANRTLDLDTAKELADSKGKARDIALDNHNGKLKDVEAKTKEVQTKTEEVAQKQTALDQLKNSSNATEEQLNTAQSALDKATGELKTAEAGLEAAKLEEGTAKAQYEVAQKAVQDQDSKVAQAQRDLGLANEKLTATETALTKAKSDYVKTVQDVAAQYEEKYQTAVERQANPPAGADKAQLKADVAKAKSEMEMAFAVEAKYLTKDGAMTPAEQKDLVAAARTRVDLTTDRATRRTDFKSSERTMTLLVGINNLNQSINQVTQSLSSNLAQTRSAEATRQGADAKKEEEMLDQTKDLFAQEQKLIDQAVQLCSTVTQTENQSMRDAIQA